MARVPNGNWNTTTQEGKFYLDEIAYQRIAVEVLMDIRGELEILNNVFRCYNALAIPGFLKEIRNDMRDVKKNTTKRKYVRKAR